jgi:hypothetical protein
MVDDASRSLWTAAERESLIEGVRFFLLHGPRSIPWAVVWSTVQDRLPGRSFSAAKQHYNRARCRPEYVLRAKGEGGSSGQWSAAESAILAEAVATSQQIVEAQTIDWGFVHLHASALTGRSTTAIGSQWITVSTTPAAKAMLEEVAEALARPAAAAPQHPQAVSPFHLLHSLRSSGCLDEATLSVCWRATVAAMQG